VITPESIADALVGHSGWSCPDCMPVLSVRGDANGWTIAAQHDRGCGTAALWVLQLRALDGSLALDQLDPATPTSEGDPMPTTETSPAEPAHAARALVAALHAATSAHLPVLELDDASAVLQKAFTAAGLDAQPVATATVALSQRWTDLCTREAGSPSTAKMLTGNDVDQLAALILATASSTADDEAKLATARAAVTAAASRQQVAAAGLQAAIDAGDVDAVIAAQRAAELEAPADLGRARIELLETEAAVAEARATLARDEHAAALAAQTAARRRVEDLGRQLAEAERTLHETSEPVTRAAAALRVLQRPVDEANHLRADLERQLREQTQLRVRAVAGVVEPGYLDRAPRRPTEQERHERLQPPMAG